MPSTTQPPSKRARTSIGDSQGRRDPSEELSEVAGLVERRRLQNRISQRNYRNKIRDRLEALEALVDSTNKGDALKSMPGKSTSAKITPSRSVSPPKTTPQQAPSPATTHQHDTSELPTDHTDLWKDMPDFLDTSADLDNKWDYIDPSATTHPSSLANFQMTPTSPSSFTDNVGGPDPMSINQMPSPALTTTHSLCMQPLEAVKPEDLSNTPTSGLSDKPELSDAGSPSSQQQQPQFPYNPFNYACPFTMGGNGSMMPMNPPPFPSNLEGQSMQHNYFTPQQYVWVPVPVMSLPTMPVVARPPKRGHPLGEMGTTGS